jgi:hypothetical protein
MLGFERFFLHIYKYCRRKRYDETTGEWSAVT